jgi:hypothetical protein
MGDPRRACRPATRNRRPRRQRGPTSARCHPTPRATRQHAGRGDEGANPKQTTTTRRPRSHLRHRNGGLIAANDHPDNPPSSPRPTTPHVPNAHSGSTSVMTFPTAQPPPEAPPGDDHATTPGLCPGLLERVHPQRPADLLRRPLPQDRLAAPPPRPAAPYPDHPSRQTPPRRHRLPVRGLRHPLATASSGAANATARAAESGLAEHVQTVMNRSLLPTYSKRPRKSTFPSKPLLTWRPRGAGGRAPPRATGPRAPGSSSCPQRVIGIGDGSCSDPPFPGATSRGYLRRRGLRLSDIPAPTQCGVGPMQRAGAIVDRHVLDADASAEPAAFEKSVRGPAARARRGRAAVTSRRVEVLRDA